MAKTKKTTKTTKTAKTTKTPKQTLNQPEESQGFAKLISQLTDAGSLVSTVSDSMSSWRYIDFVDGKTGLPSIAHEYLIGARGYLAGRIVQARAQFSKGKSSYMYQQYASGQRTCNAFCMHMETEGAPPPADYVASFGVNPEALLTVEHQSLEDCLQQVDDIICRIRGGFGGGVTAEGRKTKSVYTDPIDPDCEYPIIIGIDSLSSLGAAAGVEVDVADVSATAALSWHTRKIREYMRTRVQRFKQTQTLLMLSSHETAKIEMGRSFGGPQKSSLAGGAIGIHATYGLDFDALRWNDKSTGEQLGDRIKLFTFKNKLSPRNRTVELYLRTGQGFDLATTDVEFLLGHPASPFSPSNNNGERVMYRHSRGITCKPLSDKSFTSNEELVAALYENTDLISSIREKMRIRGYGFDFETQYHQMLDEQEASGIEDTEDVEASVAGGDDV